MYFHVTFTVYEGDRQTECWTFFRHAAESVPDLHRALIEDRGLVGERIAAVADDDFAPGARRIMSIRDCYLSDRIVQRFTALSNILIDRTGTVIYDPDAHGVAPLRVRVDG